MKLDETRAGRLAKQFATALTEGAFEDARALLHPELALTLPPRELQDRYEAMTGGGEASFVGIVAVLEDWPDKAPGDIAVAYTAIRGEAFSEAVTVVVTEAEGRTRIRSLDWGRS